MDPLAARAGQISERQEVNYHRVGHVTAAATQDHVGTVGGAHEPAERGLMWRLTTIITSTNIIIK